MLRTPASPPGYSPISRRVAGTLFVGLLLCAIQVYAGGDRRPLVSKPVAPAPVKRVPVPRTLPAQYTYEPIALADFQPGRIDFTRARVEYNPDAITGDDPAYLEPYLRLWDARAAAVVRSSGDPRLVIGSADLLHFNDYRGGLPDKNPEAGERILSLLLNMDYFPEWTPERRQETLEVVSEALLAAKPGWAGTFGPGMDNLDDLEHMHEGNYDMAAMHLIPVAYRYYDQLSPDAASKLVNNLIALGRVKRIGMDDTFLSGATPGDWTLAGNDNIPVISTLRAVRQHIGETENHILMITSARYLANQLIWQHNPQSAYNNRANDHLDGPPTTDLLLSLLRDILRGDFSEYNAIPYQKETRFALLNLASYAYDAEVRIAARMVLDYVAARHAVSGSDHRRYVPFRRIHQPPNSDWDRGLVDWQFGADPLVPFLMLQTGNVRALDSTYGREFRWGNQPHERDNVRTAPWMLHNLGYEPSVEVASSYRLPLTVLDLFVNDDHRRFYQRLHRTPRADESAQGRNCDHYEINAGSPSYLLTAGGKACTWAVDPRLLGTPLIPNTDRTVPVDLEAGSTKVQFGVALSSSFMPAGSRPWDLNDGKGLILFGEFSDRLGELGVENYGVAPDLVFGYGVYLPPWFEDARQEVEGNFTFVDQRPIQADKFPGFFLALYRNGHFALMEAFDTRLNPDVPFWKFKARVLERNGGLEIRNDTEHEYTTYNGNRVHFMIWNEDADRDEGRTGAKVLRIDYCGESGLTCEGNAAATRVDRLGDAANVTNKFLNGTVLYSDREAVVRIHNPYRKETITLDMYDKWNPVRTVETEESTEIETREQEVWVDFDYQGEESGNFFQPFNTLSEATRAVAEGGTIKLVPGTMTRPQYIEPRRKRVKLVTPALFVIGATPQR